MNAPKYAPEYGSRYGFEKTRQEFETRGWDIDMSAKTGINQPLGKQPERTQICRTRGALPSE